MSTSEKANLARIRDNQRRSRARRKEYLQELEAKLRSCELQGVEASAEIQIAARAVADENRRLRALLNQNGIGSDVIDAYLQQDNPASGMVSMGFNSGSDAAQNLQNLLDTRTSLPCDVSCVGSACNNLGGRESLASTASTTTWEPSYSRRASEALSTTGQTHNNRFLTPASVVSQPPSIMRNHPRGIQAQIAQIHQSPRVQGPSQSSFPPDSINTSTVGDAMPNHDFYSFNPTQAYQHQLYSSNNPLSSSNHSSYGAENSHQFVPVANNTSGCLLAVDMITSMSGGDPSSVRKELGCGTGTGCEVDCEVDNHIVFSVMDQYTGVR